jgi:hypothetical protein
MDQIKRQLQNAVPMLRDSVVPRADLMLGTLAVSLVTWAIAWMWITAN